MSVIKTRNGLVVIIQYIVGDVYKRQCVYSNPAMAEDDLLYTPMDEIVWVLATEFMEPSSVKIWFLNDAGAVSYTHLDVYKRQPWLFFA